MRSAISAYNKNFLEQPFHPQSAVGVREAANLLQSTVDLRQ